MPMYQSARKFHLDWMFADGSITSDSYRIAGGGVANYMGLCTAAPNDNGSMANESTVTTRSASFSKTDTHYTLGIKNSKVTWTYNFAATWAAASGTGTLTHWFAAPSGTPGTNHQFYAQLPYPVNVTSGDVVRFEPFRLEWSMPMLTTLNATNWFSFLIDDNGSPPSWTFGYSWYVALSTTAPNPDGTNFTEPTVGGYARVAKSSSVFISGNVGSVAYITNDGSSGLITFPTATADWPTVTHWGFFSPTTAPFTNELHCFGELNSPVTVLTGETPRFLKTDWRVESGP